MNGRNVTLSQRLIRVGTQQLGEYFLRLSWMNKDAANIVSLDLYYRVVAK